MSTIVNGNGRFLVVALMIIVGANNAHAQTAAAYPSRAIRIVVPFTPGGPNDILARTVGQKLSEVWGRQVIVENRPGGGTVIATELVANAVPDGHTLLVVSTSHAVNPSLMKKLPFDVVRDFAPVVRMAASPNVLVVHPSLPVRNVRDLVALAKAKPGQIIYGSGGIGSATHLSGELLCSLAGVKMTHVPYGGAGPVTIDLLRGEVQWMFGTIMPTLPQIKAGKLRAIAVSGTAPAPTLPDVPPVAGTLAGFDATSWYGIFAPGKTPRDVIVKLNAEIVRALGTREMRERLAQDGSVPVGDTPDAFSAFFQGEVAKWAKVIRDAGLKSEL
ncbi:MAG: tripartite tricarboxylate transporter substrate binding protein [Burkholderiales bacterium]